MAPWSGVSPKMSYPALSMTPFFFYCRIVFYSKNGDVCTKLELKMLRFDRDMTKKLKIFKKNCLWTKNAINQQVFKNFSILLFYMVNDYLIQKTRKEKIAVGPHIGLWKYHLLNHPFFGMLQASPTPSPPPKRIS